MSPLRKFYNESLEQYFIFGKILSYFRLLLQRNTVDTFQNYALLTKVIDSKFRFARRKDIGYKGMAHSTMRKKVENNFID